MATAIGWVEWELYISALEPTYEKGRVVHRGVVDDHNGRRDAYYLYDDHDRVAMVFVTSDGLPLSFEWSARFRYASDAEHAPASAELAFEHNGSETKRFTYEAGVLSRVDPKRPGHGTCSWLLTAWPSGVLREADDTCLDAEENGLHYEWLADGRLARTEYRQSGVFSYVYVYEPGLDDPVRLEVDEGSDGTVDVYTVFVYDLDGTLASYTEFNGDGTLWSPGAVAVSDNCCSDWCAPLE